MARNAGSRPAECAALDGVDQGAEESEWPYPVLVANNGTPKERPEVEDVPGMWSDSESEELDERPSRCGKASSAQPTKEFENYPELLPFWN